LGVIAQLKTEPPSATGLLFLEGLEKIMEFPEEHQHLTKVHANEFGEIVIDQPTKECSECGRPETSFVYFTPARARLVAAEILRLADEIESL
jgi:hypothetical protein